MGLIKHGVETGLGRTQRQMLLDSLAIIYDEMGLIKHGVETGSGRTPWPISFMDSFAIIYDEVGLIKH